MAQTTIGWTATPLPDGTMLPGWTFNPWRGCCKRSKGCRKCYAEVQAKRNPKVLGVWGPNGTRPVAAEAYWQLPLKWNAEAKQMGIRRKVFCASIADVFEGPDTCQDPEAYKGIQAARQRLFAIARDTNWLDWLFLTKRPEFIPEIMSETFHPREPGADWWTLMNRQPIANWWFGTSVEDQETGDFRIPHLLKVPAVVHFLSCEPLLGPVDLTHIAPVDLSKKYGYGVERFTDSLNGLRVVASENGTAEDECDRVHWVICGGESGHGATPMHPEWARSLRDQCAEAGTPFFFKQWGENLPYELSGQPPFWETPDGELHGGHGLKIIDDETCEAGKGWHSDSVGANDVAWKIVGKEKAGRLLDGKEHNGFPEVKF